MSYKLVNVNDVERQLVKVGVDYFELNMQALPHIYADLPNGLDKRGYDVFAWDDEKNPNKQALTQQKAMKQLGYWIRTRKEEVAECIARTGMYVFVCSECGKWEDKTSEYCPNCGTRLVELKEKS